MIAAALCALAICAVAPAVRAQNDGSISGTILDVAGKPWPEIVVQIVSDQGSKFETKTDGKGKYAFNNLRSGAYTINVMLPAQEKPFSRPWKVSGAQTAPADFDFKEIVGKQGAEYEAAVKKQTEEKQKFEGMKAKFEAGIAALGQAQQAKTDLTKAPADQRDAAKQKVKELSDQAVKDFEEAKAAAPEKDPNMNLILARLGDAYELDGRSDDAIAAYKQAIELKPVPGYYNNLGGILGRAGKIDEATAAYQKSAELDPPNAAQAWRNFGITMYNAQKFKEAVEPLKKATELDPKNAQAWYLLGTVMVGSMGFKKVGDKQEPDIQPGTVEAYQKAIELDPNGTWGVQAKQGLEMLQQIAPGIDTKIGGKKKKS